MKKILASLFLIFCFLNSNAQNDSLKQYTGTYIFPDGSVVSEITVTLDSTGLVATSAMGSSELKRTEGDLFEVVAYGGLATFKRNAENKIAGVHIQVGDINLEGTKKEESQIGLLSSCQIQDGYFTEMAAEGKFFSIR